MVIINTKILFAYFFHFIFKTPDIANFRKRKLPIYAYNFCTYGQSIPSRCVLVAWIALYAIIIPHVSELETNYLKFLQFFQKSERFFIMYKMHQHVRTHYRCIFFS